MRVADVGRAVVLQQQGQDLGPFEPSSQVERRLTLGVLVVDLLVAGLQHLRHDFKVAWCGGMGVGVGGWEVSQRREVGRPMA